jgi:beta-exotoxin I transport system permease protein
MTAFRMELRRNRSLTLWLALAVGGYAAVMGFMYPIMLENDELFSAYMETFPKEFLAAFGMTGLLSDPGVFFTTYIGSWLWPIIATAAGLLVGTRAVAADLDRGFLDLPLSTPTTRVRYLAASIAGQLVVMAVLAVVAILGLWTAATAVGAAFDLGRFALAGVLSFALGCAIAGPATLASVATLSRGMASGIVGGVVILMYAIFVVSGASADWRWIGPLSAWSHYGTTELIDHGVFPLGDLALFVAIAVGAWTAALWAFRRRDLAA